MTEDLKRIEEYTQAQMLVILLDICNSIYIARNITLREDDVVDNLKKIDRLFRDENLN
jgi:hypothetical protein